MRGIWWNHLDSLLPLTLSEVKREVQHCQWLLQSPMNIPKSNTPTSQNTQRLHYVLLSAQEERSAPIEGKMTFTEWIPPVIKGCHYTHGASPRYYWNNFGEGTDEITMEQPGYAILKPFWWWHFIVDRGGERLCISKSQWAKIKSKYSSVHKLI